MTNPFLSLAVLDTDLDFSPTKNLNPYCAQNRSQGSLRQHLPFPPTPFPDGGKGARMGGQVGTESDALGVLGLAKTVSRKPMVMVSVAIGLHGIGGRSPPPKRGRLGGGRCACGTL